MSPRIPMMTEDEIQTELGWIRPMIYSLLDAPDSGTACRLYRRERVLAVAQSPEGQAAQRRWDATLRSSTPNTGLDANWASQQSLPGECWSHSDSDPTSALPITPCRPASVSRDGMASLCRTICILLA
jgi:hypothetical protein